MLSSCATNVSNRIEDIAPRESFVRIIAEAAVTVCFAEDECMSNTMKAYASGVIVSRNDLESQILTAGHVCDTADLTDGIPNLKEINIKILVLAENGQAFETNIVRIDPTIDCCLLTAKKMTRWKPIRIRQTAPKYGEKVYNMASPLATASDEMTPFLEGRYSGVVNFRRAAYTIPAAPGSSGSPVFDKRGKLVGMIHSVYSRFPFLSFSPTHEKLLEFLEH